MLNAMKEAGIRPDEVDYINAHGTSTYLNDKVETIAIKRLGDHAYKTRVSSTKSMTGHLLGAAGAVEAVACILAIRDQIVPPPSITKPDPDCDLNYVPNQAEKTKVRVTLSNSLGFGGHNACIAFKAFEE